MFSKDLFGDVDLFDIDFDKEAGFIIKRVLYKGMLYDWFLIRDFYGLDRIASECKKMEDLDPFFLYIITSETHTNKEDYLSYQIAQSNPDPEKS